MSNAPRAYPLQWPVGKLRTPWEMREHGRFSKAKGATPLSRKDRQEAMVASLASYVRAAMDGARNLADEVKGELAVTEALRRLQGAMDRLGARLPVVSTNLEPRLDGLPRSGQRKPEDPGAALYFRLNDTPVVLACDHYDTVAANLAAIAAHIDAMRAMERHGVGSLEQMFAGFAAQRCYSASA